MSGGYYKNLKFNHILQKEGGLLNTVSTKLMEKLPSQLEYFPKDCEIKIEISLYDRKFEEEKRRTEQQNKYYHKLLDIICDYTGDEHMDMHLQLKCRFLSRPYVVGEKEYIIVGSTTTLNSRNFSSYLERIFEWASNELGLVLPTPN